MKQGKRKQYYLWLDVIEWIEEQARKQRISQSRVIANLVLKAKDEG